MAPNEGDNPPPAATRRVLLTGNAGYVGRMVAPALVERGHFVRGFDRDPADNAHEHVTADLTDADALHRAVDGVDTVVHLAANPATRATWNKLIGPNVLGLYNVFHAAHEAGVRYVIAASSVHAVTRAKPRTEDQPIRISDGPGPGNLYGMTKVWAEEMGRYYALNHDLAVLAVRIAWFPRLAGEMQHMIQRGPANQYFSHDDAQRFFIRAVEADLQPGRFEIVFAVSKPQSHWVYDPEPARQLLGYEPRDVHPEGSHHDA